MSATKTMRPNAREIDGEALWAALPFPVALLGEDDSILAVNPAAESFLMASSRNIVGKPLWERLLYDAALAEAFARARHTETPLFVNDMRVQIKGFGHQACNLRLAPYSSDTSEMLLVITPLELGGRLPQQSTGKTSVRSAIGMAEMLAHEIKNPLAGITGAAQLIAMNLGKEDLELTDLIVAESHRIVKLLEQVEQFGNLSPPDLKPTNLHDVLDRARRSALVGIGLGMEIVEDYDPSLPLALVDPDQLLQVLLNLLKNAADAAGRNGRIRLHTYYEHGFRLRTDEGLGQPLPLQIEVIDNGPGVPPELMKEIFDPFVSGKENGTGLGLALTAKIIGAHNGWVTCSSEPGKTVFRISLPRAPETTVKTAPKTKETN